jgi:AcrR family transcriptional regulator
MTPDVEVHATSALKFYSWAMVKKEVVATGNRQAAYSARNKARLIKDAQEVLAEIGPSATIEQIAAHAEVSPTTIYKYFENKDELFIQALGEMWHPWVSWAFSQSSSTDELEAVFDVTRRLFRVKETHPHFAQVLHNTLSELPDFFIRADEKTGRRVLSELASAGLLNNENFEHRYQLWESLYFGLVAAVHVTESLSPAEADVALGIGLSVWGISEAKAKKITSRPIRFSLIE